MVCGKPDHFLEERFFEMNISSALVLGVAIVAASYVLKPDRNPPYRYHLIQVDGEVEHILREATATGDLCTMPLGMVGDPPTMVKNFEYIKKRRPLPPLCPT
jgi:hypothetical protein